MLTTDLEDNLLALALAIISEKFMTIDQCWQKLEDPYMLNFKITDEEKEDIWKLRNAGLTNLEVAKIFGKDSGQVSRIYQDYQRGMLNE